MLEVPTLATLVAEGEAAVIAETDVNEVTRDRSAESMIVKAVAEAAFGLHSVAALETSRFLSQHNARPWASFYGVTPKVGGKAQGSITITGTDGAVLAIGKTFSYAVTGLIYEVMASATIVSGTATTTVQALESGSAGNIVAGQELDLQESTAGIDPTAIIDVGGLIDGSEPETNEELWERILLKVQSPGEASTPKNLERWAREIEGVTRAKCISGYYGPGHTLLLLVNDGITGLVPSPTVVADVYDAIWPKLDEPRGVLVVSASNVQTVNVTYANLGSVNDDEKAAILKQLKDLFRRRAGWGESLSPVDIDDAAAAVVSRLRFSLTSPLTVQTANSTEVLELGTVTWT
jgi:uncharacterized phage protein gp47/JayE